MTDEAIIEASQYRGRKDLVALLCDLHFIDGSQSKYKLHDWEDHQPWVCGGKARSDAAQKAARARWNNAEGMRSASATHAERNAPSPSPSPSPSPKIPAAKPAEPKANEAVKIWTDLFRELRDPEYNPSPIDCKQCQYIFKHVKKDLTDFEKRARNYLKSEYVKMPTAAKLYAGIENYKTDEEYFDMTDRGG